MNEALNFIGRLYSYIDKRIDEIDDALMNHTPTGQGQDYWKGSLDALVSLRRIIYGDDEKEIKDLPPNIPSRFIPPRKPNLTGETYGVGEPQSPFVSLSENEQKIISEALDKIESLSACVYEKVPHPRYTIIEGESLAQMSEEVDNLMADGWKPQGGISVNMFDDDECYWYAQAMVKYG